MKTQNNKPAATADAKINGNPSDAELTVIVVSFNTRKLTIECLEALYTESAGLEMQVIVVDNASEDGSADAIERNFPDIELIRLEENIGFARANNLAGEHARGEWILLLNPDTVVLDRAIPRLLEYARQQKRPMIYGARTLFPDGSLNPTSVWGRPTLFSSFCFASGLTALSRWVPVFDRESMRGWSRDTTRPVDIVSGCFLMLPREVWEKLGGFDTSFFMYGEDFDLCLRARSMGVSCMFYTESSLIHYGGASAQPQGDKVIRHLRAKQALMQKHWPAGAAAVGRTLLKLRVGTRVAAYSTLSLIGKGRMDARDAWGQAWRRRSEWTHHVA